MTSDRYAWALETAQAIRDGELARIDRITLAEELEQLSRADRRELKNLTKRIIEHLIKVRYYGGINTAHWQSEVWEFQDELEGLLEESPSLKAQLTEALIRTSYERGLRRLRSKYGEKRFAGAPNLCPFTAEDVLTSEG